MTCLGQCVFDESWIRLVSLKNSHLALRTHVETQRHEQLRKFTELALVVRGKYDDARWDV